MKYLKKFNELNERNWKLTIDLKNEWQKLDDLLHYIYADDDFSLADELKKNEEFKKAYDDFYKKLQSYQDEVEELIGYTDDYINMINDFDPDYIETVGDFGNILNNLYDFADENSIWVKTEF